MQAASSIGTASGANASASSVSDSNVINTSSPSRTTRQEKGQQQQQHKHQQQQHKHQQQTQRKQKDQQPDHSRKIAVGSGGESSKFENVLTSGLSSTNNPLVAQQQTGSVSTQASSTAAWSGAHDTSGICGSESHTARGLSTAEASLAIALKGEPEEQSSGGEINVGKRRRGIGLRNDRLLPPNIRQDAAGRGDQDGLGSDGNIGTSTNIGIGMGVKRRRKSKREGSSFYTKPYFEWTDELMVSESAE